MIAPVKSSSTFLTPQRTFKALKEAALAGNLERFKRAFSDYWWGKGWSSRASKGYLKEVGSTLKSGHKLRLGKLQVDDPGDGRQIPTKIYTLLYDGKPFLDHHAMTRGSVDFVRQHGKWKIVYLSCR